ncbi:hypothetical protein RUM43_004954 [Polyplax serrata]|uniref:peptide-methionine (R)-S-oxide reductase n=1 Tax=Polyplax serrata TaxID=468196 RepID=A0AAN8XMA5_POLSC
MFSSLAKYEHHTPWPAFKKPFHSDSLTKIPEEGRPNALKTSNVSERLKFNDPKLIKQNLHEFTILEASTQLYDVSCGRCRNGLGHEFLRDRADGGSRF